MAKAVRSSAAHHPLRKPEELATTISSSALGLHDSRTVATMAGGRPANSAAIDIFEVPAPCCIADKECTHTQ